MTTGIRAVFAGILCIVALLSSLAFTGRASASSLHVASPPSQATFSQQGTAKPGKTDTEGILCPEQYDAISGDVGVSPANASFKVITNGPVTEGDFSGWTTTVLNTGNKPIQVTVFVTCKLLPITPK